MLSIHTRKVFIWSLTGHFRQVPVSAIGGYRRVFGSIICSSDGFVHVVRNFAESLSAESPAAKQYAYMAKRVLH